MVVGCGGLAVVVVEVEMVPTCASSHESHGGPATHEVSYKYMPSADAIGIEFRFGSMNNHSGGGLAGRSPGPHCWQIRQLAKNFSESDCIRSCDPGFDPQ